MTGFPSDIYEVRTRGLAFVEDLNAETAPWFVHMHLIEPHLPYDSPEKYVQETSDLGSLEFDITSMSRWEMQSTWEDLSVADQKLFETHVKARYNAQTRHMNTEIELLFTVLTNQGLLKDTLVVIFADHGEQLFEHGSIGHTASLHSQENSVRAFFWAETLQPNSWPSLTGHHDLVPTILEQLDLPIPAHITGVPAGKRSTEDVLFAYLLNTGSFSISAISEDYKLIYESNPENKSLYNTTMDKEEQYDLFESKTEPANTLWLAIEDELSRIQDSTPLPGPMPAGWTQ